MRTYLVRYLPTIICVSRAIYAANITANRPARILAMSGMRKKIFKIVPAISAVSAASIVFPIAVRSYLGSGWKEYKVMARKAKSVCIPAKQTVLGSKREEKVPTETD